MIPIVMSRIDDADAHGFVTNNSRPGGNITGLSFQSGELSSSSELPRNPSQSIGN